MKNDVYKKLAGHLDNLPGGFPSTDSGVELRILRRLFTPEEAAFALHLTLIPEEPRVVARRAKMTTREASERLEEMALKGLVFRMEYNGSPSKYMASQFIVGIWEYHVNDLDAEFIKDVNEYLPKVIDPEVWKKAPQLRTIPVGKSISADLEVLTYERAESLVRAQKKFLVAPCICRREHNMVGNGCKNPEEVCLVFGRAADYYERNGLGRVIDVDETLKILKKAEKAGLVLQPSNAQRIINICCCCGCCCQVLKNLKRYPRPADLCATPFVATSNPDTCEGCGVCVERCQMEALKLEDDTARLDADRCIGCGLCVSTCPTKSLSLVRKPQSRQPEVPKNMIEASIKLGRARGKLSAADLVQMQLKSKLDRLLASK